MKMRLSLLAMLALAACDSGAAPDGKADPTTETPAEKVIKKDVDQGVKDELAKRGPKWKVEYSGDLTGAIEGGIMTAGKVASSMPRMTVVGAGMKKDNSGQGTESFGATISGPAGKEYAMVKLTLADGTRCSVSPDTAKMPSELKLIEPDPRKLRAVLKGSLACGEQKDKVITYMATLNAHP